MSTSKRARKHSPKTTARTFVRGEKISTLDKDLAIYLDWLCVKWGFCIPSVDADKIAQSNEISATEFASAVLAAEGLDNYSPWFNKIKKGFEDRFGTEVKADTYSAN